MVLNHIKALGKPRKSIFVLNDQTGLSKEHRFNKITWDYPFESIRKSILICEDLVCLSNRELKLLTTFVNIMRRHNDNTIILVTHSLRNNNLYSLICHMHFFIFMSNRSNVSNWNAAGTIFKIPDDLRSQGQEFFSNPLGKYYSMVLNCSNFNLTCLSPNYQVCTKSNSTNQTSQSKLLDRFSNIFKGFDRGPRLYAFAHFLVLNLPSNVIAPDLSVVAKNKQNPIKISMVDYIHIVSSPDEPISKPMRKLHLYILSYVTVPQLFIQNKHLL